MHACIHAYIELYMYIGLHIYRVSWLILIFPQKIFAFYPSFRKHFPHKVFRILPVGYFPHSAFYPYPNLVKEMVRFEAYLK